MSNTETNIMPEFFANTEKLITTDDRVYFTKNANNENNELYDNYDNNLDDNLDKYKKMSDRKLSDVHGSVPVPMPMPVHITGAGTSKYTDEHYNDKTENKHNFNNINNLSTIDTSKDTDDVKNWSKEKLALKKLDLIRKLGEMKQYGVSLSQNYSMESDYETMKFEYDLHYSVRSKKNAVKLMCYLLVGVVKGAEMANDRYNPFDMKFDGAWSKNVGTEIADYNEILGEIYEKWSPNGSKMSPEFRLMFALVGSAFTIQFFKGVSNYISDNASKSLNDADVIKNLREKAALDKTMLNNKKVEEQYTKEHNKISNIVSNVQWLKESGNEYDNLKRKAENNSQVDRFKNNLLMSESAKSMNIDLNKQKLTQINSMLDNLDNMDKNSVNIPERLPANKAKTNANTNANANTKTKTSSDTSSRMSHVSEISVNPNIKNLFTKKMNSVKTNNINYEDISVGTKSKKSKDTDSNGSGSVKLKISVGKKMN